MAEPQPIHDDRMPADSLDALTPAQFEQVMLLADGELSGAELASTQALLAANPQAQALFDELTLQKNLFRNHVLNAPPPAMAQQIADNVLRQTVARAERAPVATAAAPTGLWTEVVGWLRGGVGKLALAAGAVAAAAVWLVVSTGHTPGAGEPAGPVALGTSLSEVAVASAHGDGVAEPLPPPLGEIEELEVESGSVLVAPADDSGSTVIWHFAEGQQG